MNLAAKETSLLTRRPEEARNPSAGKVFFKLPVFGGRRLIRKPGNKESLNLPA